MKTYCQDFGGKLKGTGQRQILPARKICSGLFCASKKAARAKRCFAPLPRPTYKKNHRFVAYFYSNNSCWVNKCGFGSLLGISAAYCLRALSNLLSSLATIIGDFLPWGISFFSC